jgi:hypothetical protein
MVILMAILTAPEMAHLHGRDSEGEPDGDPDGAAEGALEGDSDGDRRAHSRLSIPKVMRKAPPMEMQKVTQTRLPTASPEGDS